MSKVTLSIEEVADITGRSPDWLRRNWLKFHLSHGFPRRLPGCSWRWPSRAVELWAISGGRIAQGENDNGTNNDPDFVQLCTASLLQKYGTPAI